MAEHGLKLRVLERLYQTLRYGDRILLRVHSGRKRIERVAVHDLEFWHGDATGDTERLQEIPQPRLLPAGGFVTPSDQVDEPLVKPIGDQDPQSGAQSRPRHRRHPIAAARLSNQSSAAFEINASPASAPAKAMT